MSCLFCRRIQYMTARISMTNEKFNVLESDDGKHQYGLSGTHRYNPSSRLDHIRVFV